MAEQETFENLSKMKVAELKAALAGRGLSTSGNKNVLIERLQAALLKSPATGEAEETSEDAALQEAEDEPVSTEKADSSLGEADISGDLSLNESTEVTSPPSRVSVAAPKEMTAEERAAERMKRFGAQSQDAKLKARAEKFGFKTEEVRKLERAQRFGLQDSGSTKSGSVIISSAYQPTVGPTNARPGLESKNADMLKKRAERFGQVLSPTLVKSEDSEKMRKRKERFGVAATGMKSTGESEEKKRKRAERFGLVQS